MNDFKERFISRVDYIPTLPVVFNKILQTLNNPKSSAKDLKTIIINDMAISAKILNLANSAYFGFNRRITEITNAIVVIGFKTIKNIVLSISIIDTFKKLSSTGDFDRTQYWLNSIGSAQTAVKIGTLLNIPNKESLYISGLLSNIGRVLMDYFFPEFYTQVIEKSNSSLKEVHEIEKEIFGFDHTEAGFQVARKWEFPDSLADSIRFHHNLENAPEESRTLSAIVDLSNIISRSSGLGTPVIEKSKTKILKDCSEILNLNNSDIQKLIDELQEQSETIKVFFKVIT
ncbi:HDOD domain-containing protein [candidate division KSB1 bacterium]